MSETDEEHASRVRADSSLLVEHIHTQQLQVTDPAAHLSGDLARLAEEELGETPAVRMKALRELMQLCREERAEGLRCDEYFLLRFLRQKKFNVAEAMTNIHNYDKFRAKYKMTDITYEEVEPVLQSGFINVLPGLDVDGRPMILTWAPVLNFRDHSLDTYVRAMYYIMEWVSYLELVQLRGFTVVENADKMLKSGIMSLSWKRAAFVARDLIQDAMPIRFKMVYVVNEPFLIRLQFGVIRLFLKRKLRERIVLIGRHYERWSQHVDTAVLPPELGGEWHGRGTIRYPNWHYHHIRYAAMPLAWYRALPRGCALALGDDGRSPGAPLHLVETGPDAQLPPGFHSSWDLADDRDAAPITPADADADKRQRRRSSSGSGRRPRSRSSGKAGASPRSSLQRRSRSSVDDEAMPVATMDALLADGGA